MPKNAEGMPLNERAQLVDQLIGALWREKSARDEAREYYQGGMLAFPVHRYFASMKVVAKRVRARKRPPSVAAIEPSVPQTSNRYSPGFAASSAIAAVKACRVAGASDAELARCIEHASDPEAMMVGRATP